MRGRNRLRECGDRVAISDVELVARDANVRAFHKSDGLGKAGLADVGERQMTTALCQRLCDRTPDAGARAGDHSCTVLQPHARLPARCESFENTSVPSSIVPKRSASMSLA